MLSLLCAHKAEHRVKKDIKADITWVRWEFAELLGVLRFFQTSKDWFVI